MSTAAAESPADGWVGRPLRPDELARVFGALDRIAAGAGPSTLPDAAIAWRLLGRPRLWPEALWLETELEPQSAGDASSAALLAPTREAWRELSADDRAAAVGACSALGAGALALEVVLGAPALLDTETVAACWTALPACSPGWIEARGAALGQLFRRTTSAHAAALAASLVPLLHAGHLAVVEALLGSRAELPAAPVSTARAWLSLWRDRPDEALSATGAPELLAAPGVATLRAIARLRGRCDRASVAGLSEILGQRGLARREAELLQRWRSEGLLRLGHFDEAEASTDASSDQPVGGLLQRLLALGRARRATTTVDGGRHLYTLARLRELGVPCPAAAIAAGDDPAAVAALWRAVDLFGGNRGDACTVVEDGRLRGIPLVAPRRHAELLQRLLLAVPVTEVLAGFGAADVAYPMVPYFRTYACEVQMWSGAHETARATLASLAEETRTRWAYIGLGAAAALAGDAGGAESAWRAGGDAHPPLPAEATPVWRGELALRTRQPALAVTHLEQAVSVRPTRLRPWLLLVLARAELGDRGGAWEALRRAIGLCPGGAWRVLSGRLRQHLVASAAPPPDPIGVDAESAAAAWLERLRGNASSVRHTWDDPTHGLLATEPIDAASLLQAVDAGSRSR